MLSTSSQGTGASTGAAGWFDRRARRAGVVVALGAALAAPVPMAFAAASAARPAKTSKPAAAATKVVLKDLVCTETEDWTGGDELYIRVNGRKVWTSADSVNTGESVAVNRKVDVGDTVALYDEDPEGDDFLGSDIVEGTNGTLVFKHDDASYSLDYEKPED